MGLIQYTELSFPGPQLMKESVLDNVKIQKLICPLVTLKLLKLREIDGLH